MASFFETATEYQPPSWIRYGFGTKAPLSYAGLSVEELERTKQQSVAYAHQQALTTHPGLTCLLTVTQRHTTKVLLADAPHDAQSLPGTVADGLVCPQPGMAVAVKTADCLPVLLMDETRPVVAAIHAGWRGTVDGIVREGVALMTQLGCKPENLTALLGPCARVERYEVGEDVARAFVTADLSPAVRRDLGPKAHVDLIRANSLHLERLGLTRILTVGACTLDPANATRYDSWRREQTLCGRMLSFIGIVNDA